MEQALSIIKDAQILCDDDLTAIAGLQDELMDTFKNVQIFRTRTEMEASVLNDIKFPTPDSKYWQAVREQNVMYQELVMLSYDYRKNQVEIKMLQREMQKELDELGRELLQIEIDKKQFIAKNQERTAKARIREIKEWSQIKINLLPELTASKADVNEHQLLSYTRRFIRQARSLNSHTGIDERNNLLGQLKTCVRICKEKGCLDQIVKEYPEVRKLV